MFYWFYKLFFIMWSVTPLIIFLFLINSAPFVLSSIFYMFFNLIKIFLTFICYFLPAILFFCYFLSFGAFILSLTIIYQFFVISLFWLFSFYIPFFILSYWRKLEVSFISFLAYCINNCYLLIQLFACYFIYFYLDHDIFLKDLSLFSQYRYLIISITSILVVFCFIFFYSFNIKKPRWIDHFTYPYMKMHVSDYLSSWENSFAGNLCADITDLLAFNNLFRFLYFFSDFFIKYFYKVILLYIFIHFCFFNGSLNYILYLSPLTLFFWLCKSVYFYYYQYFINNREYIFNMVIVNCKNPAQDSELPFSYAKRQVSDFNFTLSPIACEHKLEIVNLPVLASCWFKMIKVDSSFKQYYLFSKPLHIIIISAYFFCYYYIAYNFF